MRVLFRACGLLCAIGLPIASVIVFSTGHSVPNSSTAGQGTAAANQLVEATSLNRYRYISIIGDSYTTGTREGGIHNRNWTRLLVSKLQSTTEVAISVGAEGGVGYVQRPPGKKVYKELAQQVVGPATDITIFVGTRNDRNYSTVGAEALAAFQAVRTLAPESKIIVIGPIWPEPDPPQSVLHARDQLRTAAESSGATWVDPIRAGWFSSPRGLIGADGIHPTDSGNEYLATEMAPTVNKALSDE